MNHIPTEALVEELLLYMAITDRLFPQKEWRWGTNKRSDPAKARMTYASILATFICLRVLKKLEKFGKGYPVAEYSCSLQDLSDEERGSVSKMFEEWKIPLFYWQTNLADVIRHRKAAVLDQGPWSLKHHNENPSANYVACVDSMERLGWIVPLEGVDPYVNVFSPDDIDAGRHLLRISPPYAVTSLCMLGSRVPRDKERDAQPRSGLKVVASSQEEPAEELSQLVESVEASGVKSRAKEEDDSSIKADDSPIEENDSTRVRPSGRKRKHDIDAVTSAACSSGSTMRTPNKTEARTSKLESQESSVGNTRKKQRLGKLRVSNRRSGGKVGAAPTETTVCFFCSSRSRCTCC